MRFDGAPNFRFPCLIMNIRHISASALLAALSSPLLAAIDLAPTLSGSYAAGTGASALFVKVDDNWQGSTVLWNEDTLSYGSGSPIGSYGWGTGIWGIADWNALIGVPAGQAPVLSTWSGLASQINFGNTLYNDVYAGQWGSTLAMPQPELQTNWLAQFTGYIRITEADAYNFSVLYDDGFFFKLYGSEGNSVSIEQDGVNPRDREGFADDLMLEAGLYRFELGVYNRLEAGVVDLRWSRGGSGDWTLVPTEALVTTPLAVPEPAAWAMLAGGLALVGAMARRRR